MKRSFGALYGAFAVFAFALILRTIGIDQDAAGDELYTFLAAKQYLADGSLQIHQGEPYTRARAYTVLIAEMQRVFGDSLSVARIPAAIFGSLAAAALFWWLRREGHALAAWLAGILLATSPESIILSQQVRFYTAEELAFLTGCLLAYFAAEDERPRLTRGLLVLGSLGALALAVHLQPISIIGVGGLGTFVLCVSALRWKRWIPGAGARRLLVVAIAAVGAFGVWFAVKMQLTDEYARLAQHADLWAQETVDQPRFYFWRLRNDYPSICLLFPLLALAAAACAFRVALLCLSVFCVAFAVHSCLPWKSDRYLEYAMPFFFAIGALGWARMVSLARNLVARLEERPPGSRPGKRGRVMEAATLVLTVALFLACNDGFKRTATILRRDPRFTHPGMETGAISWSSAAPRLRELAAVSDALVSSADTKALFYLGRVNYVLNRDHVADVSGKRPEFSSYPSVGIPVFNTPESLRRVVGCHRSGIVVVEGSAWRVAHSVPPETADLIEATLQPVEFPSEYGLKVFRWTTEQPGLEGRCPPGPDTGR